MDYDNPRCFLGYDNPRTNHQPTRVSHSHCPIKPTQFRLVFDFRPSFPQNHHQITLNAINSSFLLSCFQKKYGYLWLFHAISLQLRKQKIPICFLPIRSAFQPSVPASFSSVCIFSLCAPCDLRRPVIHTAGPKKRRARAVGSTLVR